ncbi:MAG TPA: VCBS domain-containing protein, partial [Sphingomicrobium sp.]|nr:VCBS domain-containing protein [Sphingomicrobium sp.]
MRYEDASHTSAFQGQGPIANDDSDQLAAGSKSSATGNLITGEGTQTGSAGADSATGGHITEIAGKGGEDSSFAGGKLSVMGEYGKLSVDAEGNYVYQANKGVENVRDRFTYTLADNNGATDTAALIVEIGKTPFAVKADAQQIVVGPDGVVTLPAGVELSDVHVVGRNLVVDMPDGTQLIIIDGAVFVPQLVLNGVEVPATNVAALLIGQEIQPAAGETPPSSGGNFAVPPPPLDPGVPLGDLIPPTEYTYTPPGPQPTEQFIDREPTITIEPDGLPRSVAAVDSVDEKGLPTRLGGEPEGSGEEAAAGANGDTSEATAGTIIIDSPDGVDSVTINGVLVTGVNGQQIAGAYGTLTIIGFSGDNILYTYVLTDNISHSDANPDFDSFAVVVTDDDGDQAAASLRINIIDDVPTARPDTDALGIGDFNPATGNVITDAAAGDAGDSDNGKDTVGADNALVTAVSSVNVPANADTDAGPNFHINGQYGVLTLNTDGSYSYVRSPNSPGGVQDVFNYTLTDGDGDTSSTTLTITIPDTPLSIGNLAIFVDDDTLPQGRSGGIGDGPDAIGVIGALAATGGDGPLT